MELLHIMIWKEKMIWNKDDSWYLVLFLIIPSLVFLSVVCGMPVEEAFRLFNGMISPFRWEPWLCQALVEASALNPSPGLASAALSTAEQKNKNISRLRNQFPLTELMFLITKGKLLCEYRGRCPPALIPIGSASQGWDWATSPQSRSDAAQSQSQPCDAVAEGAPHHRVGTCPYAHEIHSQ
jgi:hypothetical protein